jgi:hypothetical protein
MVSGRRRGGAAKQLARALSGGWLSGAMSSFAGVAAKQQHSTEEWKALIVICPHVYDNSEARPAAPPELAVRRLRRR